MCVWWVYRYCLPAADKSKIEITAKHVDATKNMSDATGNVLVYYEDSVIKASSAYFYKTTKATYA